jgi:hypothetical protein
MKYDTSDIRDFRKAEAVVIGWKGNCVRLILPDGTNTALCTVTYSFNMSDELQRAMAQRIADMWNTNR